MVSKIAAMYQLPAADRVTRYEWEVKRSRFITLIARTMTEEDARCFISQVRSEFPDARHHCSAFILHADGSNPIERSSDDGEPSGTAGQPMLEALRGSGLMDVTAVVVRYFGGVKLGTGGLVHAYSHSVVAALPLVTRVHRLRQEICTVELPHGDAGRIEADLRAHGFRIIDVAYSTQVRYTLAVDPSQIANLEHRLAAQTSGALSEVTRGGETWLELSA